MDKLSLALTGFIFAASIPVLTLCVEIAAALLLPQPSYLQRANLARRPKVSVLIPAHNESLGIKTTIQSVQSQLREGDRILIVADNCSDDTAAVAASLGAEVIIRHDADREGKGYALDWGIKHLAHDPTDVVIILDADCWFAEGSIDALTTLCCNNSMPVQALYLMIAPENFSTFQFAEFAWRVKNWVRPLGLRALGLPCQLSGSGMAFPWRTLQSARLATGEIVEDLRLGLDLAREGTPALFCPSARVLSYFPMSSIGASSQRHRWERGHLNTIVDMAPRMLWDGVRLRDIKMLALALDLAVPPLSLLALFQILLAIISTISVLCGSSPVNFSLVLGTNVAFSLAILACWAKYGRDVMSLKKLISLPMLIGKKFCFYRRIFFLRNSSNRWIRTDRQKTGAPEG